MKLISPILVNGTTVVDNTGTLLTPINANIIASGTISPARLGSGTADSTTVLFGDNTWKSINALNTVQYIFIDCSTSNQSYQLPDPTLTTNLYNIKRIDNNKHRSLTITSAGTNITIDGKSSLTMGVYQSIMVKSYNGQWYII